MNRKVWIIKICKALNQSLWGIRCSGLAPDSDPVRTLAPSHKAREERGLLPAGPLYKQVLESSSKCFFQSHGASTSLGFPSFPPPTRAVFTPFLQKTPENCLPLSAHSRLAPTFILLLLCPSRRHQGPGEGLAVGSRGARGWQARPAPHRRREVMSKQVTIMRWALQKLTRLSRRSVTHSSASRYSRESSSQTCSKSTAKEEKAGGDAEGTSRSPPAAPVSPCPLRRLPGLGRDPAHHLHLHRGPPLSR